VSVRLSVCLSVCLSGYLIYRPLQGRAVGLLLGAPRARDQSTVAGGGPQSSSAAARGTARRSAANASSVTRTAAMAQRRPVKSATAGEVDLAYRRHCSLVYS